VDAVKHLGHHGPQVVTAAFRRYRIRDEPTSLRDLLRGEIVLARIVLRLLAGLVVPSATPLTRRRIGEILGVLVGSLPGGSDARVGVIG
jgi:hypothetical protein